MFVCGMALTLAACTTTVGVDEAFSGDTGNSYVLIAGDGMQTGDVETHDFKFQRVDMASSTFLKEYVYVRFGHKLISGGGDEFQKPATMAAATVRYAGHKIAPGDYALCSTRSSRATARWPRATPIAIRVVRRSTDSAKGPSTSCSWGPVTSWRPFPERSAPRQSPTPRHSRRRSPKSWPAIRT